MCLVCPSFKNTVQSTEVQALLKSTDILLPHSCYENQCRPVRVTLKLKVYCTNVLWFAACFDPERRQQCGYYEANTPPAIAVTRYRY